MNFCSHCGEKVVLTIPKNDDRHRFVCPDCHTVHYQNPNIVAGVLPYLPASEDPQSDTIETNNGLSQDRILLCKRGIQPRYGLWTLPAGFMENGETIEQAARRESREEANLELGQLQLYTVMSLPHINQVYMLFLGQIITSQDGQIHSPGEESLETRLYSEDDIPWEKIAFPVIHQSLKCYFEDRKKSRFPLHNLVHQIPIAETNRTADNHVPNPSHQSGTL